MPDWTAAPQALTLFSEDLDASIDFYRRFLGAEPVWGDDSSSIFAAGPTMINLLKTQAVAVLIAPAKMAPPGVRAVYTLSVTDVDAHAARLQAVGIALLNGPIDRPWGVRTLSVQDPGGHVWELAMPLRAG